MFKVNVWDGPDDMATVETFEFLEDAKSFINQMERDGFETSAPIEIGESQCATKT